MNTFAERKDALERLKWEFVLEEPPYDTQDLELFKFVRLPLTPYEWCRLCMRDENEDSEYVAGCCGTMSAVQDTVNEWFRNGGRVHVKELVELGEAMRDHGDFEEFKDTTPENITKEIEAFLHRRESFSAWRKIGLLYQIVKDHYEPEGAKDPPHVIKDDLERAFMLVHRMAWSFGMGDFFKKTSTLSQTQSNAQRIMRLFRFVPALRQIYEHVQELTPEAIEGWALVNHGEVVENTYGLCIYATKTEAERAFRLIEQAHQQKTPEKSSPKFQKREFKIRAVRVSTDKGIEFLEPGILPLHSEIRSQDLPHWLEEEPDNVEDPFEQWGEAAKWFSKKEQ